MKNNRLDKMEKRIAALEKLLEVRLEYEPLYGPDIEHKLYDMARKQFAKTRL